jgi:hypothetical protein
VATPPPATDSVRSSSRTVTSSPLSPLDGSSTTTPLHSVGAEAARTAASARHRLQYIPPSASPAAHPESIRHAKAAAPILRRKPPATAAPAQATATAPQTCPDHAPEAYIDHDSVSASVAPHHRPAAHHARPGIDGRVGCECGT